MTPTKEVVIDDLYDISISKILDKYDRAAAAAAAASDVFKVFIVIILAY